VFNCPKFGVHFAISHAFGGHLTVGQQKGEKTRDENSNIIKTPP
jgi:hypothetical protein